MEKNRDLTAKVTETMNAFDGIHRAESSPFFYSKLMLKMDGFSDKSILTQLILLISRPRVAMGILIVFLILNGFFFFQLMNQKDENANDYVAMQQSAYLEINNYQP